MTESLESFVKKLQSEGVDAGKEAAEEIKKEATLEAEKILADAKEEAEKIVAKAKNGADKQISRAQTELELAVRDALLKLRESLGNVLSSLLMQRTEKKLSEPEYIGEIIREVITTYAKADAGLKSPVEVNISKKTRDKFSDSVLKDLSRNLGDGQDKMGLHATLSKAGFEYKIHGATVEVSPDSVSELLSEMVNPALQEIIDTVLGKQNQEPSGEAPARKGGKKPGMGRDKQKEPEGALKGKKP